MKKILLILAAFLLTTSFALAASAREPTPSPALKKETIKEKIEDLKERLATRVAQLRAQNRRAFFGQIKEKRENTLTLVRGKKEQKVTVGEKAAILRTGSSGEKTTISLKALAVGEKIVVFGNLDLDQKTLLAKRVLAQTLPKNIHGKVAEVDLNAGTITVAQNASPTWVIDYEIRTKCKLWKKEEGLKKCGLSKIGIGDRVFVRGLLNKKEKNRATALRLLILPGKSPLPAKSPTSAN